VSEDADRAPAKGPPPGPPWDLPIDRAPLVFVDLEMTGLGEDDRIIEVCAERVVGSSVVDRIETLVRPCDAKFGNAHIHGIQEADLASAPKFADVADRVSGVLDGAIFVAHGARYDIAFLRAEMARLGRAFDVPFPIDTLVLARRAFGFHSHTLAALARELDISQERAHRAGDDVRVLRAVFRSVVDVLRPTTARDLFHVRVGERMARPAVLEAARQAARAGTPVKIRYRRAGKPAEQIVFVVTRVVEPVEGDGTKPPAPARTRLDPPVIFGYLLPGRGRRELRADRILSIEPHVP
jgi:DNA polymerase-3 subunit epsilon